MYFCFNITINRKIKFLAPKDGIEEEFLLDSGIADLSVDSLAEIPKYIIKDFEKNEVSDTFHRLNDLDIGLREQLNEYEKPLINKALEESKGNIVRAANILKIPRSTLHYKMDSYGVGVNKLT